MLVDERGLLSTQAFLDSVAFGNLTPGPIVIASTHMGLQIGEFSGALAATLGVFLAPLIIMLSLDPFVDRLTRWKWIDLPMMGIIPSVCVMIFFSVIPFFEQIHWDNQALAWGAVSVTYCMFFKSYQNLIFAALAWGVFQQLSI